MTPNLNVLVTACKYFSLAGLNVVNGASRCMLTYGKCRFLLLFYESINCALQQDIPPSVAISGSFHRLSLCDLSAETSTGKA